jgi:hypothetical protein
MALKIYEFRGRVGREVDLMVCDLGIRIMIP